MKGLLAGFMGSWTKARMKLGGQELEVERDLKLLGAAGAALASSTAPTAAANASETAGSPPPEERILVEKATAPHEPSGESTPSAEETAAAWRNYFDATEAKIIEIAAQSPKAALAYAVNQAEMVLARNLHWPATVPLMLSTAAQSMQINQVYNPTLVNLLTITDRLVQELMSDQFSEAQILSWIWSWAKLPRTIGATPLYAAGMVPAKQESG